MTIDSLLIVIDLFPTAQLGKSFILQTSFFIFLKFFSKKRKKDPKTIRKRLKTYLEENLISIEFLLISLHRFFQDDRYINFK